MKISYFGEIADKTEKSEENIEEISSVKNLVNFLNEKYQLDENDFQIAINHSLIEKLEEIKLNKKDEIAILSPFAGG